MPVCLPILLPIAAHQRRPAPVRRRLAALWSHSGRASRPPSGSPRLAAGVQASGAGSVPPGSLTVLLHRLRPYPHPRDWEQVYPSGRAQRTGVDRAVPGCAGYAPKSCEMPVSSSAPHQGDNPNTGAALSTRGCRPTQEVGRPRAGSPSCGPGVRRLRGGCMPVPACATLCRVVNRNWRASQ